jgi:hypothetical protein
VIVVRDPIFGLMAYGGDLEQRDGIYSIICKDGIQQRVELFISEEPMQIVITSNHFSSTMPITVNGDGTKFSMPIEVDTPMPASSELKVSGVQAGEYELSIDGRFVQKMRVSGKRKMNMTLHLQTSSLHTVGIHRIAN